MSVLESDVEFYGSANMPDADALTTGGALATATLIFFSDISPTGTVDYVSSSASDTAATLQVYGRDATGVVQNEIKTLNGTTKVTGSQSFERLLKGLAAGTAAVGDIAILSHTAIVSGHTAQGGGAASGSTAAYIQLQAGDGAACAIGQIIRITNNTPAGVQYQLRRIIRISGDFAYVNKAWGTVPSASTTYDINEGMLFESGPNQVTQCRRPFYNASADVPGGSTKTYYEKIFAVNNNTATAVTVVNISKQADPSAGTLEFALTTALNDTATVANRQTAPGSGIGSFSTGASPQTIAVPGAQNLPSGAAPNAAGAQGIWLSLALAAGTAAAKTSFQMQAQGQST
jgi:hypothetical protein